MILIRTLTIGGKMSDYQVKVKHIIKVDPHKVRSLLQVLKYDEITGTKIKDVKQKR